MSCEGDPVPLTDDIVAERAARLAQVAEETCRERFGKPDWSTSSAPKSRPAGLMKP